MSKKIYGIGLLLLIMITVGACAGKETSVVAPTQAATATPLPTKAPEPTATPEPTEAPEPTMAPQETLTPEPTEAPEATATPEPTEVPESTATPEPTEVPEATATPEPTEAPEPTEVPEPTEAPKPTVTPSPTPSPTPTPEPEDTRKISKVTLYTGKSVELAQAAKGDVVFFGAYEQDGNETNGVEKIAWKVLDKTGNRVLLLSMYVLDAGAFHPLPLNLSWNDCELNRWLQDEFVENAFSEKEQKQLLASDAGKAFLLSLEEVQTYFSISKSEQHLQDISDNRLAAVATEHAKKQGVWSVNGNSCWWLRSGGTALGTAVEITEDGDIYLLGTDYNYSYNGVRPAIWLEVK